MSSQRFLDAVHRKVLPRRYLEIGVCEGATLALALSGTSVIGVDPSPKLREAVPRAKIFSCASDDYFASHDPRKDLGGPIDLTFIDGLHHFEVVLRDFMNAEAASDQGGVILIDDCLPNSAAEATREMATSVWAGDVWKALLALRRYRPDLHVGLIPTTPTGTGLVTNLDPASTTLRSAYERIVNQLMPLEFDRSRFVSEVGLLQDTEAIRQLPRRRSGIALPLGLAGRSLRHRAPRPFRLRAQICACLSCGGAAASTRLDDG